MNAREKSVSKVQKEDAKVVARKESDSPTSKMGTPRARITPSKLHINTCSRFPVSSVSKSRPPIPQSPRTISNTRSDMSPSAVCSLVLDEAQHTAVGEELNSLKDLLDTHDNEMSHLKQLLIDREADLKVSKQLLAGREVLIEQQRLRLDEVIKLKTSPFIYFIARRPIA